LVDCITNTCGGRREPDRTNKWKAEVYFGSDYVDVGGLMSYGAGRRDLGRQAAVYVDKILKGAKPVDLPVEQPTRFE
jgi:hypothetical protein